jgi:hypothetical protein
MRLPVFLLAAAFTLVPQGPAGEGIAAQIVRVRAELGASAPEDERAAPLARLDRAKSALDAGRPLLALYLLEMPWEAATTWTFVKASSDVTSAEAFTKKWTTVGAPRPVSGTPVTRIPILVEALAAVAEARGVTTYHASKPYADDAGVGAGLYYLGESHAVMQFAAMARSLPWREPSGLHPRLRSIAAELNRLDAEMTTAYETMDRASHSAYIVASAALKQARTLDDRGQFAGALFEYLLSTYLFAPLQAAAPTRDATPELVAAARASLGESTDHSIAEMFLQLADEGVGPTATPAQHRGAAAVLEAVLPAYGRATGSQGETSASPAAAAVTITLVRWPFT